MAQKDKDAKKAAQGESALDQELEQYIEEEAPSKFDEFMQAQMRRAPWWAISFLVHAIAFLIMWKWPYRVLAREEVTSTIEVKLAEERPEEKFEEPPPKEEEDKPVEEDLDVPIEDIPISDVPATKEAPGPDLDLPPVEDMVNDQERPVPSIDPPSATPVLAVLDPSKTGLTRGIYSGRNSSGRGKAVGGGGGTSQHAESAVNAGLMWLARAQERDGRWDCQKWEGAGNHDVGCTGLALLAFLGAGFTHTKGRYKTTVSQGLNWLAANQKPNGAFNYSTFYEMGISAMAVSEAYGLTRSPKIGRMAQKAIDFIVKTQPDHGGFRYPGSVPKNEGDMSVTGWQIMAIKSAICSELNVPQQAVERSRVFLKNSYRDYGKSAYTVGGGEGSPAIWAIGMVCRQFLGGDYDAEIRACADALLTQYKAAGAAAGFIGGDEYLTYYSVLGMFQMGGEHWMQWNKIFRDPVVKAQISKPFDEKGRFVRGSWDPANGKWGKQGGRVYMTAMAILSLEVYYRFLPVYKVGK
jgi:hypothetical protein